MSFSARASQSSSAQRTSKSSLIVSLIDPPNFHFDCSTQCERKPSAEAFPKNFALIRLAEKTMAKQKQQESEEKKKEEVAALEKQINDTT